MSELTPCPFKVGQRIHERIATYFRGMEWAIQIDETKPDAIVTGITEQGFTYEYIRPVIIGRAAWGQVATGGECYPEGYRFWVVVEEGEVI